MAFKSVLFEFIKGIVISLVFCLIAVLIFALCIKLFNLPSSSIKPVNIILKITAVALSVFIAVKNGKGLLKGATLGILIVIFTYLLFSIIGKNFNFTISLLWEVLMGSGVGGIFGILGVNLKK